MVNELITDLSKVNVIIEDDYLAFVYLTKAYLHSWKEEDELMNQAIE